MWSLPTHERRLMRSAYLQARRESLSSIWPYIQIARVDHWFKNVFMLLGVLVAFFYKPALLSWRSMPRIGLVLLVTCLIASSNYVINEIIDAPRDRFHPIKNQRPAVAGVIRFRIALLEWLFLGALGIAAALAIDFSLTVSALMFWVMGVVYNVPPLRTKELPYLDVLSESVNNPIRLFLGWFALIPDQLPPLSLTLAYWMVGAFFMGTKRFAEYRQIGDAKIAAQYRKSFGYYTEERLLVSMFFYATMSALFAGVFLVRYHLELILFLPVAAGFFAYYLKLGLRENSPVQNPEKLCKEGNFLAYLVLSMALFAIIMFMHVPALYDLFNVEPAEVRQLWVIGSGARY